MKIARVAFVAVLSAALAAPTSASPAPTTTIRTLVAPAPSWYTPDLHARVMAAGPEGVAVPPSAAVPASTIAFLGIRPGQLIIIGGALCTTNFVFRNGADYAIGTAGHCGGVGEPVTMVFAPSVLANIGTITKSVDGGIGNDFALISIKASFNNRVSPSMAYWGGPTGSYSGSPPRIVEYVGHGLVVGTGGVPRVGIGTKFTATEWRFVGAVTPGDSGSGAVTAGGKAIGNITHFLGVLGVVPTGINFGTSITRIKQIAGLPLATCPHIPWPLFGCPRL